MDEKDQIEYFSAFRNTTMEPPACLLRDSHGKNRVLYIRECCLEDDVFYDLVLGDNFRNECNMKNDLININFNILMKELNCDSVSIYNIDTSDDWSDWYIFEYYNNICDVNSIKFDSTTKRAINKGHTFLSLQELKNEDEIFNFMTSHQNTDVKSQVKKQSRFLANHISSGDAVCLAATKDNAICAILAGIHLNNSFYMILNKYEESILNYRPNDFLYYRLIQYSIMQGVDIINWGNTNIDDLGLLKFKDKYSTQAIKKFSAHLSRTER